MGSRKKLSRKSGSRSKLATSNSFQEQRDLEAQRILAINKNPPVPRFPHPEPKPVEIVDQKREKKPRVPPVPEHLRKEGATPTPYEEIKK